MQWRELKYFAAYISPLTLLAACLGLGYFSFTPLIVGFVLIPILEFILPQSEENLEEAQEEAEQNKRLFDFLLYLNLPFLYFFAAWVGYLLCTQPLQTYETVGLTTGLGFAFGVMGINVAHELGHRDTWQEQLLAKFLLLPSLYMHFFIEHNRGHHVHIATDEDPASSRRGEWLYAFWLRSLVGGFVSAARLEGKRLRFLRLPFLHWRNEFLCFLLIQALYIGLLFLFLPAFAAILLLLAGLMGALLLETVNYIEHYGLRRRRLPSGRYERVQPHHSWNSNHTLGRILLYELTRHSDHHYKASRKYQILRHLEAPNLPLGYPAAMLLALLPPLWFWYMNPKVDFYRQKLDLA